MDHVHLPRPGDLFLDRWRIDGEVGKGGFSVVFRAVDLAGRVAAIKILLPQPDAAGLTSYDGELADRFLREARLLEHLDSPYTIRMWEFGQSPQGLFYMIFEFVSGRSLFEEIRHQGAMAPDRVIHVLRQMLIGLQSAHKLGILHRDVKPNNVMLFDRDGDPDRVKLLDFGIAKMFGEGRKDPGMDLTAAGLLVGTPRYMSPEQLRNGTLGPPSDLYSMGLCAIEMLTGQKCIAGKDRVKIMEAQLGPKPFEIPPDVACPQGLRDVVHRLTQKNLHARYRSAAEAVRDLEALAGDPGATGDTVFQSVPSSLGAAPPTSEPPDEDTVLHRLSASDLDELAESGRTILTTVETAALQRAASGLGQAPADDDRTLSASSSSGTYPQPPQSRSSTGERHTLDTSEFATGPTAALPAVSIAAAGPLPGFGEPPPAALSPLHPPQQTNQNSGGTTERAAAQSPAAGDSSGLERSQLFALAASFLLPGVGHLMLGQLKKGALILAALVLTLGLGWILLAPASLADAFLVIRARRRRAVGELEFFPDHQELL